MTHPQLNYSNIHLAQKMQKHKWGNKRKKIIKAVTLHTNQGYLAVTVLEHLFWKQNWLPKTSNDSL